MKKSECTVEEWDKYLAYQRIQRKKYYQRHRKEILAKVAVANMTPEQIEQKRSYWRERNNRPEVVARRKALDATPEYIARRKRYANTDAAKLRAKHRLDERLASNPGLRDYQRNYHRLLRTGFTYDLMEACLAFQNHACAVCRRPFNDSNKGHADHCHDTNTPRGVLCFQCNIIDGKLKLIGLSPLEFGQRMHDYLENPTVSLINKSRPS